MFVERAGEIDAEQLLVVYGQTHHPPGKTEVAQVVWIDVGMAVRLEGRSCRHEAQTVRK